MTMKKVLVPPDRPIAASGAMGFDGRGWLWQIFYLPFYRWLLPIIKTITLEAREGNPLWRAVWPLLMDRSCVNASGWRNPGLRYFLQQILPTIHRQCIVSLGIFTVQEAREILRIITDELASHPRLLDNVLAFEVNISCHNVEKCDDPLGILRIVADLPKPIIIKLGEKDQSELVIQAIRENLIQGVDLINTIPWDDIRGDAPSPLEKRTGQKGAISGRLITERGIGAVRKLTSALRQAGIEKVTVIGGGGIGNRSDAERYRKAGATHISLGTVLNWNPVGAMWLLGSLWVEKLRKRRRAN
jgi:dihydroorotate dehydrogenase